MGLGQSVQHASSAWQLDEDPYRHQSNKLFARTFAVATLDDNSATTGQIRLSTPIMDLRCDSEYGNADTNSVNVRLVARMMDDGWWERHEITISDKHYASLLGNVCVLKDLLEGYMVYENPDHTNKIDTVLIACKKTDFGTNRRLMYITIQRTVLSQVQGYKAVGFSVNLIFNTYIIDNPQAVIDPLRASSMVKLVFESVTNYTPLVARHGIEKVNQWRDFITDLKQWLYHRQHTKTNESDSWIFFKTIT